MKKIFKKAMTVFGTFALVGATISGAAAAAYPSPFTANSAVVVGAQATMDMASATLVMNDLNNEFGVEGSTSRSLEGGETLTNDEVTLGGGIPTSGDFRNPLVNKYASSLFDGSIDWYDGFDDESYDVYETIEFDGLAVKTTLDDEDFTDFIALSNDRGIEYKLVFEENLSNIDYVGMDNTTATADSFYLTILGKEYEITEMSTGSIKVVTSEEHSLREGDDVTVDGESFVIGDIIGDRVEVNGEFISEGETKRIKGMRVKATDVISSSDYPERNRVFLRIGEDIEKTYSDSTAFIGEPTSSPEWVWSISNPGVAGGYIGVKYDYKLTRAKDELAGIGDSYFLPNDFAAVTLEGMTDTDYTDIEFYFDDGLDLWNSTSEESTAEFPDEPVLVIELKSEDEEAITLETTGDTSNKIYLRWASNTSGIEDDYAAGSLEVLYKNFDVASDEPVRDRFSFALNASGGIDEKIAEIEVSRDVTVDLHAKLVSDKIEVTLVGPTQNITVNVGDLLSATGGDLVHLGDEDEDDETTDVSVVGTSTWDIGTKEKDIMNYDGFIVRTPSSNANKDVVVVSVPTDDEVYAKVSVTVGGEAVEDEESSTGVKIYKDTESASFADKNIVVVGGSAINAIAAELLDGNFEGAAFTEATTVDAGKFLIESFTRNGKTAVLVAGYNAADTEMGVDYLLNEGVDTTVGNKYVGTSGTSATLVTA